MTDPIDNQEIERLELESRRDKCQHCCGTGEVDTGGFTPWGASISDACPYCDGSGQRWSCRGCQGLGTPAGEAAGMICGACNGTGIECNVCED